MPLLVEGRRVRLPQSAGDLVRAHPLLETSELLSSISILGSDDATTCHIVVLRHTGNGATCLTHCDGTDTKAEVPLIMNAIKSFSDHAQCGRRLGLQVTGLDSAAGPTRSSQSTVVIDLRLEVHLVGGFSDDRQLSQKLTHQLLSEFDRQEDDIHLVTLCVTELNDREENENHFPIIYGIAILSSLTAVNVKTAEIYRASFQDRGPEEELRAARALTGGPMISIYDAKTEQLRIGPYSWMPFPHVDFWLQQDDKQILENLSTSPLAEPPHFVEHIRSTLMFLKKHPSPTNTLFPGNKALLYKKNEDGLWEKISSPGS
ncbi:Protein N-terminal asparagine amidohydrolase [Camelus dromedarius]|uniref:Protein N-terminal asparagine amidohydrolase n=1 Tax=Camelus dromedarius TaxID=9838 RepID=A0A5N4CXY7_CAMDR|nr:Protein N-terminal asparagine amidohydrolase [Camelus dromedarius]